MRLQLHKTMRYPMVQEVSLMHIVDRPADVVAASPLYVSPQPAFESQYHVTAIQ